MFVRVYGLSFSNLICLSLQLHVCLTLRIALVNKKDVDHEKGLLEINLYIS